MLNYNNQFMYEYIYYHYFYFSKFFRDHVPGSMFYDSPFDAVMLLSLMEFLNIVTFGAWIKISVITVSHNLDMFLLGLTIFGLNSLYFLKKKSYIKIINKCKDGDELKKTISRIFTVIYSILSCYIFYLVHSSN